MDLVLPCTLVPDGIMPWHPEVEVARHGRIQVVEHVKGLIAKDKFECCPQLTERWFKVREQHLTASSAGAMCGVNKYETPRQAMLKKLGLTERFTGNEATRHGQRYEMEAIRLYEEEKGAHVIDFGLLKSVKTEHDGQPIDTSFLAGSPDGITSTGRLIEVKCPLRRKITGEIPVHYVHQVQMLMHILDLEVCDFIEYKPGSNWMAPILSIVTIERSDEYWTTNFPLLSTFWKDFQAYSTRLKAGEHPETIKALLTDPPKLKRKRVVRRQPFADKCHITVTQSDLDAVALLSSIRAAPFPEDSALPAAVTTVAGDDGWLVSLEEMERIEAQYEANKK